MIKAIFFDFNGVIIDDEPLQLKAAQDALQAEGITLTESDYYDSLGMDDLTFFRAAFARAGREPADEVFRRVLDAFTKSHRELIAEELPLFPGVVTFIKAVSRHYTLAVVSMARRANIEDVLARAGLAQAFTVVVSAEDVSACKPDPACVNRALEKLNEARRAAGQDALAPAECLVIEDSPPGIEAARVAGMRTLGVTNTVGEQALRAAGADVVTANLADWTDDAVRHVFNQG
ncbi:MAG TPA: HAD family phosphatase [Pyrinomonadaceae bacterium]|jgi:HAD superfamily hydrolase (TIGR01509 family)|nr:HAD family phosphatase [Pyrinomonadaceae bacterium]